MKYFKIICYVHDNIIQWRLVSSKLAVVTCQRLIPWWSQVSLLETRIFVERSLETWKCLCKYLIFNLYSLLQKIRIICWITYNLYQWNVIHKMLVVYFSFTLLFCPFQIFERILWRWCCGLRSVEKGNEYLYCEMPRVSWTQSSCKTIQSHCHCRWERQYCYQFRMPRLCCISRWL